MKFSLILFLLFVFAAAVADKTSKAPAKDPEKKWTTPFPFLPSSRIKHKYNVPTPKAYSKLYVE